MTIAAGTRLGPYEIEAPLGAGGMGEVYRARDVRLDRTVAVKVLSQRVLHRAESRKRFEREARVIASLNHPHICALHDVGQHDGLDFLVMEFVHGETLAARLARGALPLDLVLRHASEIAGALVEAHRAGVVHRDLKPANIMLTDSGVKLLDFGLAKLQPFEPDGDALDGPTVSRRPDGLTSEGVIVGTFQYMAPEQLEGRSVDARTDLFAFGAVVYEMATGQRAFQGTSQASLIAAILDLPSAADLDTPADCTTRPRPPGPKMPGERTEPALADVARSRRRAEVDRQPTGWNGCHAAGRSRHFRFACSATRLACDPRARLRSLPSPP